jgi:selenocysteine lyase/cysteine desulfurase
MWSRRDFIRISSAAGVVAAGDLAAAAEGRAPTAVAGDEGYWRKVRRAFDVDPAIVNLNNGNSSPSPRSVEQALTRGLDFSNRLPVYYRGLLEQTFEAVRQELARTFGCDAGELAFARNATEALHIAQCGVDLQPGDEVVTTDQDYTLMLWAWQQRAMREQIRITRIQFPVPATGEALVRAFAQAITPRTKVLHFCHITNVTGQLFPVRELSALARQRGIMTIVDGAQAAGHFPFSLRELGCDVYGTSLHKWLMAPHGTGFLYVRREMIPRVWPLHAEVDDMRTDIRKFEEVGTQPAAARAAIADALRFHHTIGAEVKAARLHYLTRRWAEALKDAQGVRMLSSLDPDQTWAMATLGFEDDVDVQALSRLMFSKYRIVTSDVVSQRRPGPVFDFRGLRITPNIYTTVDEIDRFVDAITDTLKQGLPKRHA